MPTGTQTRERPDARHGGEGGGHDTVMKTVGHVIRTGREARGWSDGEEVVPPP